jgi:hypothetical protein
LPTWLALNASASFSILPKQTDKPFSYTRPFIVFAIDNDG